MILLLGGTKDSRELASFLSKQGFKVLLTVTTSLAQEFVEGDIKVRVGRLTETELDLILQHEQVEAVLDATHPFAEIISKTAFGVTQQHKIPYLRFERPEIKYPSGVVFVEDFKQAAKAVNVKKVFAAIGVRHLKEFLSAGEFLPKDVFVRVLPSSLEECINLGIPKKNIFTGIGPFSYEDNYEHLTESNTKCLVTKASGPKGGEEEKISAALNLGMKVIVVKRPEKQGKAFHTKEEILTELRRTSMKTGLVVLAHGSKRQETKETLAQVVSLIKAKGKYDAVEEAFLQFNTPVLEDAVNKLAEQEVTQIVVAPYFLFKGVHNTEDIPGEIASLREKYPNIEMVIAEPLGVDERLADILIERAQEVAPWNI